IEDPDRVVRLYTSAESGFGTVTDYSTVDVLKRELRDELESLAAYHNRLLSLGRGENAERVEVVGYDPNFFDTLGIRPQLGSIATTDDEPFRAAISHALWQRRFGGVTDIVGQTLRLGSDIYTIEAVMPQGFTGIDFTAVDVWVPLSILAERSLGRNWRT